MTKLTERDKVLFVFTQRRMVGTPLDVVNVDTKIKSTRHTLFVF